MCTCTCGLNARTYFLPHPQYEWWRSWVKSSGSVGFPSQTLPWRVLTRGWMIPMPRKTSEKATLPRVCVSALASELLTATLLPPSLLLLLSPPVSHPHTLTPSHPCTRTHVLPQSKSPIKHSYVLPSHPHTLTLCIISLTSTHRHTLIRIYPLPSHPHTLTLSYPSHPLAVTPSFIWTVLGSVLPRFRGLGKGIS